MAVEIKIEYTGQLHCMATHGPSQVTLATDAPVDNGGKGAFFSPTDLVATALGSCMLTIMGLTAQGQGLDITGASAQVLKEMTAAPVRRIGSLTVRIRMPSGKNFTPEHRLKLERAAALCPVKQSIHPDVAVHLEFVWP